MLNHIVTPDNRVLLAKSMVSQHGHEVEQDPNIKHISVNVVTRSPRCSLHTPIDGQGGNQTEGLAYISGKTLAVGGFLTHWRERLFFLALVLAPVHLVKGNYLSDVLGRDRDMRELTKRLAFTLIFLVREPLFYRL